MTAGPPAGESSLHGIQRRPERAEQLSFDSEPLQIDALDPGMDVRRAWRHRFGPALMFEEPAPERLRPSDARSAPASRRALPREDMQSGNTAPIRIRAADLEPAPGPIALFHAGAFSRQTQLSRSRRLSGPGMKRRSEVAGVVRTTGP